MNKISYFLLGGSLLFLSGCNWFKQEESPVQKYPYRIAIIGPGAIGITLATELSHFGKYPVTLVDYKEDRYQFLQKNGVVFEDVDGKKIQPSLAYLLNNEKQKASVEKPFDLVIFATKDYSLEKATAMHKNWIQESPIIAIENGIDFIPIFKKQFPNNIVTRMLLYFAASWIKMGQVKKTFHAYANLLWEENNHPELPQIWLDVFEKSNLKPTLITQDIPYFIWHKLLINCTINAASAIGGEKNGILQNSVTLRPLAIQLLQECLSVMDKELGNQKIKPEELIKEMGWAIDSFKENTNSMTTDFVRKTGGTEIDFLNGAIITRAKKYGISVPANELVTDFIKRLTKLLM